MLDKFFRINKKLSGMSYGDKLTGRATEMIRLYCARLLTLAPLFNKSANITFFMLDEVAIVESSAGDSCVVIMDVLSSDPGASFQDKKQKQLWPNTPLCNVDVTRLNQYIRVVPTVLTVR
ncbi:MAG TPA: hypothetical protein EYP91_06935 [Gammaproteobacteria bacterium]|nr:hypothetical protein [Gammaproteobacteria bacterium]